MKFDFIFQTLSKVPDCKRAFERKKRLRFVERPRARSYVPLSRSNETQVDILIARCRIDCSRKVSTADVTLSIKVFLVGER